MHKIGRVMKNRLECIIKKVTSELTFGGNTGCFLMVESSSMSCE